MSESKQNFVLPVTVALITGLFASIPGILSFVDTPRQIEAEISQLQIQNEMEVELQRDRTVADLLARLDDPRSHVRSGAALSLSALAGDTIAPVLVGKLREAIAERVLLEEADVADASTELKETHQFINALKQSLFAMGTPALRDLLDLNRDLTPALKQIVSEAARDERSTVALNAAGILALEPEIKDVIRAILFKTSNLGVAPAGQPSPLVEAEISLAYADLSDLRLIRINLSQVDLSFADLRGSSLEESYLEGAQLRGTLIDDALLLEGNFDNANFRGALVGAPARYSRSSFEGADFSDARISDSAFAEYLREHGATNVPGAQ